MKLKGKAAFERLFTKPEWDEIDREAAREGQAMIRRRAATPKIHRRKSGLPNRQDRKQPWKEAA